jgi:hypothetical protein
MSPGHRRKAARPIISTKSAEKAGRNKWPVVADGGMPVVESLDRGCPIEVSAEPTAGVSPSSGRVMDRL